MKSRIAVNYNTRYKTVMPHTDICQHWMISGKVMEIMLLDSDKVQLYDPEDGSKFMEPVDTREAGLFQESGQWYCYPVPKMQNKFNKDTDQDG